MLLVRRFFAIGLSIAGAILFLITLVVLWEGLVNIMANSKSDWRFSLIMVSFQLALMGLFGYIIYGGIRLFKASRSKDGLRGVLDFEDDGEAEE